MRTAIIHDWLTGMRGGEKVLSAICKLFPQADLFTLIHSPGVCDQTIESRNITTSFLNRLPGIKRYYRYLLPLMPFAIERLNLSDYDLIISSSHCVAKGIRQPKGTRHICYCHSPMRYVWAQKSTYQKTMGLTGLALRVFGGYLRKWDMASSKQVTAFIANSKNIAGRIQTTYRRKAHVVYPPIDTDFYTPAKVPREDFYLMVTALAPYKRVEQAIEAMQRLDRRVIIIGSGQQMKKLKKITRGNVHFLGWQSNETIRDCYRRCQALIFPGEEDFGMVPLEAMACGTPVIAYGAGGALETVLDLKNHKQTAPTGVLYTPQTVNALVSAVLKFEENKERFRQDKLVSWASRFGYRNFTQSFKCAANSALISGEDY